MDIVHIHFNRTHNLFKTVYWKEFHIYQSNPTWDVCYFWAQFFIFHVYYMLDFIAQSYCWTCFVERSCLQNCLHTSFPYPTLLVYFPCQGNCPWTPTEFSWTWYLCGLFFLQSIVFNLFSPFLMLIFVYANYFWSMSVVFTYLFYNDLRFCYIVVRPLCKYISCWPSKQYLTVTLFVVSGSVKCEFLSCCMKTESNCQKYKQA